MVYIACPKPLGKCIVTRWEWDSCPSARKCCFCPLVSLPYQCRMLQILSFAGHKFGGCSPPLMWEMPRRTRGFWITKCFQVCSISGHFALGFFPFLEQASTPGVSNTSALLRADTWLLVRTLKGDFWVSEPSAALPVRPLVYLGLC